MPRRACGRNPKGAQKEGSDETLHRLTREKRALLRHLLQKHEAAGGSVLLPLGVTNFEDWILDAVDVDAFLPKLKSEKKALDVAGACYRQPDKHAAADDALAAACGRAIRANSAASSSASETPSAGSSTDGWGRGLSLGLPELEVGVDKSALRDIVFVMLWAAREELFGKETALDTLEMLRTQLEVSEDRARELKTVLVGTAIPTWNVEAVLSIRALVQVAVEAQPSAFARFRSYAAWRDDLLSCVVSSLCDGTVTSAHSARLKGAVRRVQVRDAKDFDPIEAADAACALSIAASSAAEARPEGWGLPWALRVSCAETLLCGMFDIVDEATYAEGADAMQALLRTRLFPRLGLPPAAQGAVVAWVHFCQAVRTRDAALFENARASLAALLPPPGSNASPLPVRDVPPEDTGRVARLQAAVCDGVIAWAKARLRDYHAAFPARTPESALLAPVAALLAAGSRCVSADLDAPQGSIRGCVASSIYRSIQRAEAELTGERGRAREIEALAGGVSDVVGLELREYSTRLAEFAPDAAAVAVAAAHAAFGDIVKPWLLQVEDLSPDNLAAIRAVESLEAELHEMMADVATSDADVARGSSDAIGKWGTITTLSPVLFAWANSESASLQAWVKRMLAGEKWAVVSAESPYAGSAVEAARIARDAVDAMAQLHLALPGAVVRALTESVDHMLTTYGMGMVEALPAAAKMVPPEPALTRFKAKLADKAEAQGLAEDKEFAVPPVESDPNYGQVSRLSMESLLCRLNSLHLLLETLPDVEALVRRTAADAPASVYADPKMSDWVDDVTGASQRSLRASIHNLAEFTTSKLVYWDLRTPWLHELYRYKVNGAGLHSTRLLAAIDKMLGTAVQTLVPSMRDTFAGALLRACMDVLKRVLLDGGPYRLFEVDDAGAIEEDLRALQALFIADGDGLDVKVVDEICAPVSAVLDVMGMDTELLIMNMESGTDNPFLGAIDQSTLLRVLSHRKDRAASKFLKAKFNIKKRLDQRNPLTKLVQKTTRK